MGFGKRQVIRVLVCIPHFFRRNSPESGYLNGSNLDPLEKRLAEFRLSYQQITSIVAKVHFTLGSEGRIANETVQPVTQTTQGDVIIVSVAEENLIRELAQGAAINARLWAGPPRQLGYQCRRIFARHLGGYDLYCFIEDDTTITDPAFFRKVAKFYQTHGEDKVLLPNRFEIFSLQARGWRTYLDRPVFPALRMAEQPGPDFLTLADFDGDVVFEKTRDSQAGAYVITDTQLKRWMAEPDFGAPSESQLQAKADPMELAMIPMGGRLPIYRPAKENLDFLQVHHLPNLAANRKTPRGKLVEALGPALQKEQREWG